MKRIWLLVLLFLAFGLLATLPGCKSQQDLPNKEIWDAYPTPTRPAPQALHATPEKEDFGNCRVNDLINFSCD